MPEKAIPESVCCHAQDMSQKATLCHAHEEGRCILHGADMLITYGCAMLHRVSISMTSFREPQACTYLCASQMA